MIYSFNETIFYSHFFHLNVFWKFIYEIIHSFQETVFLSTFSILKNWLTNYIIYSFEESNVY